MKVVAICVLGVCTLMGLVKYFLMETYKQRSGLADVQKIASEYLTTRDTNVLQSLVNGMNSRLLGPKTAGALKELAPHMIGRTNEIAVQILPELARGLAVTNKFLNEPSVYAMAAYLDVEPRSGAYMDVYIPTLIEYIQMNRFGGGPTTAVELLGSLNPSLVRVHLSDLIRLLEEGDDPRLREMPDLSIRQGLVRLLAELAPVDEVTSASLEKCIVDENPYVAMFSIWRINSTWKRC